MIQSHLAQTFLGSLVEGGGRKRKKTKKNVENLFFKTSKLWGKNCNICFLILEIRGIRKKMFQVAKKIINGSHLTFLLKSSITISLSTSIFFYYYC